MAQAGAHAFSNFNFKPSNMEQQAEICETYQLKWTSFGTYMNSCISTSLYNESFADVALVTTDGHQMMAHRYVLSYSSLFLAQVLKLQRKVTTALPLMIVMPPEIDFRSLKVLVRYMYSGEAKVSKEILKKVLRGGDILQIKGLYREKEDAEKIVRITQQTPTSQQSPSINASPSPMLVPSTPPPSPAIVPPPLAPLQKPSSKPLQSQQPQQKQTLQQTAQHTIIQQKQLTGSQPTNTQQMSFKPPNRKIIVVKKSPPAKPKNEVLNFTVLQNFDKSEQQNKVSAYKRSNDKETTDKTETSVKESIQYLMIKDEPVDWCEEDMEEMEEKAIYDEVTIKAEEVYNSEDVSEEEEEDTEKGDKMFSPLTCELCSATFTLPGEWVKHVQTHTDMLPAKRRRRDSTGDSYVNDSFPELTCDLCQKPFPTPAEWVKHIQNAHTEFELHLSNKKNSKERPKGRGSPRGILSHPRSEPSEDSNAKTCSVCSKTFPSQASMLIHKRSHTGERPFQCDLCRKSFAVKSNLLRHLRTIHNMIINATDVEGREHEEDEGEEESREESST